MKRSLALILALFSPLALTQSPKEAVESALKAAFGDWRGKTYQGLDRVVYFTPEGQETQVLRIRTYLDLGGCRLRLEIAPEGEKAPATLVYTRERQFLRLPDGRETPLDDRLFLELIFAWQTGFTGAAFGYDEVASLGKVTLPDGSEAEKSGNGLRIFARHLWDRGRTAQSNTEAANSVRLETLGGIVQALILAEGQQVRVVMGQALIQTSPNPQTIATLPAIITSVPRRMPSTRLSRQP